jgi:hypothetical protein
VRVVAWNCNMALDRKVDALLALQPDIAIVCECAEPERLRSKASWMQGAPVWIAAKDDRTPPAARRSH